MTTTTDGLLAALRDHGVEPYGLRDGVHEAAHAIHWKLAEPWTRDRVAAAAPRLPIDKLTSEVLARVVERRVVERLGEEYDRDHWLLISTMEALKVDRYSAKWDQWLAALESAEKNPQADEIVEQVLALGAA